MIQSFHSVSEDCSRLVTKKYSSSFSSAIRLLHRDFRTPIHNIYGFVRFTDEIVDSFHEHDKQILMREFKKETFGAIERGISLNPILNSFQRTANQYEINPELIQAFFTSMELDLSKKTYNKKEYEEYIFGSAEAVGLMCLTVFCEGNKTLYKKLQEPAKALGAAFQKVNFLRDIKADYAGLSRIYFPNCDFFNFSNTDKKEIEEDIAGDFKRAYQGILKLPAKAKFGVYVSYRYYLNLFKKISRMHAEKILNERINIPDLYKAIIIFGASVKSQLKLI